jgi:hypothetical protein
VRLKKDSTPEDIRLKLIIDYRRLNEVTVPDCAGIGDQDEILDGFGGRARKPQHRRVGPQSAASREKRRATPMMKTQPWRPESGRSVR